jgi:hypothetical protein
MSPEKKAKNEIFSYVHLECVVPSWTSRSRMVTRFAWMAHKFVSSNSPPTRSAFGSFLQSSNGRKIGSRRSPRKTRRQSHERAAGREACRLGGPWTFGISGFPGGPRYPAGTDVAFWHLASQPQVWTCGQLWHPGTCVGSCHGWTSGQFASCEPSKEMK